MADTIAMKVALLLLAIVACASARSMRIPQHKRLVYSTGTKNQYTNTIIHKSNLIHLNKNGLHTLRRQARRHVTGRRITGRLSFSTHSRVSRHHAKYGRYNAKVQRHAGFQYRNRENQFVKMKTRNINQRIHYGRVKLNRKNAQVSNYNRILSKKANVQRQSLRNVVLHGNSFFQYRHAKKGYQRSTAKAVYIPAKIKYLDAIKVVPVLVSTKGQTYPLTRARVEYTHVKYAK